MIALVMLLSHGCSYILSGEKQAPAKQEKIAPPVTEDKVGDAYKSFTLASLALTQGDYNKAQQLSFNRH